MSELPLGKAVDYDAPYDPGLLCPIPRAPGRAQLGLTALPFTGWDIWNAYELSWLDQAGKPQVACAEFWIPFDSPSIVESKSFKLYLNSLNQQRFSAVDELAATLRRDLRACIGVEPEIQVRLPAQWHDSTFDGEGWQCLDELPVAIEHYHPAPQLLSAPPGAEVSRKLFSRLLRSRCPVTGQPDWATLQIEYSGAEIDPAGLLAYLVSFRLHQDFHEHCVERIFSDILLRCAPQRLSVYARYLRRGGLDINPFRSNHGERPRNTRCFQQ